MAHLVEITSGTDSYYVNPDNVRYVVAFNQNKTDCSIQFDKDHSIYIRQSIDEVTQLLNYGR